MKHRLPVRWHDQNIIVLDVVIIEPPYGPNDCTSPSKDETALQRVKKVVSHPSSFKQFPPPTSYSTQLTSFSHIIQLEMEKKKVVERNNSNINTNNNKVATNVHPVAAATPPIPAGGARKGG